jgi:type II secretory pathway pseudopilin PulG
MDKKRVKKMRKAITATSQSVQASTNLDKEGLFLEVPLKPRFANRPGFSLLEIILSLSLCLFIFLSALEVLGNAKRIFSRLSEAQESALAAVAASEKILEDLEEAGCGLSLCLMTAGFEPLKAADQQLLIFSADNETVLVEPAMAGQNILKIAIRPGLSPLLRKGRALYLYQEPQGELVYLAMVSGTQLTLTSVLKNDYKPQDTRVIFLQKVEIYLDRKQNILRRKVNDTSGQPLLEGAFLFETYYNPEENLARVRFLSRNGRQPEEYFFIVFPKNLFRGRS